MTMHILIAGGSGLIGRATTHTLLSAGHQVTVAARREVEPPARARFVSMDAGSSPRCWRPARSSPSPASRTSLGID